LTSWKETVKAIARAKLAEVIFVWFRNLYLPPMFQSVEFASHLLFFSWTRRRIARTSLRPPKGHLPVKIRETQAKGVRAATAIAAVAVMRAVTTGNLLSTRTILRRSMSRIRCYVWTLHIFKAPCTFV
jgi:hypothetical protein